MDTRRFCLYDQCQWCLTVLRNLWPIIIILASCTLVPPIPSAVPTIVATETPAATKAPVGRVDVRITGKYLGTDAEILCPPICVQTEKGASHSDQSSPLTFSVCSQATQECIQVTSGDAASVPEDSTVYAPDGVTPGEQFPRLEDDSALHFNSWEDGSTIDPRQIVPSNGTLELTAFYTNQNPNQTTTTATEAGCSVKRVFPNWVEVRPDPEYVDIQGPVTSTHIAGSDFPLSHNTYDLNFWVLLNREDSHELLSHGKNGQLGDIPNQIEVEWETGSVPTWAWPSQEAPSHPDRPDDEIDDADFVWVKGKHIFDCGHQDEDKTFEGAWTEIHPPIATAAMKGTRQGKLFPKQFYDIPGLNERSNGLDGVEIDVWINGDGGGAVEQIKCGDSTDPSGTGCIFDPAFDINRIYEFDVPLPPPPANLDPEAKFLIAFSRLLPGQPEPEVTQTSAGLHVKLDLSNYQDTWLTCKNQNKLFDQHLVNCNGGAYGVTIIAGWETFAYPTDLHQIRLTFEGVTIYDDMEGEGIGDGEFKFLLKVGPSAALVSNTEYHVRLEDINSGFLDAAGEGETYDLIKDGNALTYVFYIRENNSESNQLYFVLDGVEDDEFFNDYLFDISRTFYIDENFGNYVPPDWATVDYGNEIQYGTVRQNTSPPLTYEDGDSDLCLGDELCPIYSIKYFIEELPLP